MLLSTTHGSRATSRIVAPQLSRTLTDAGPRSRQCCERSAAGRGPLNEAARFCRCHLRKALPDSSNAEPMPRRRSNRLWMRFHAAAGLIGYSADREHQFRNRCSRWIGISVQDGPEYAGCAADPRVHGLETLNREGCSDLTGFPCEHDEQYRLILQELSRLTLDMLTVRGRSAIS